MKNKYTLILTVIALCIAFTSCKKESKTGLPSIQINAQENGKTVALAQGQSLKLTLENPADGGYAFDTPQYDSSVMSLNGHTHTPSTTNAIGDGGTDTWEFIALKSGTTALTITASRSFEPNNLVTMFTGAVSVK